MNPTKPQAITADQYEPRRMDDATFAAHDAALGAQIDAHRERAEAIEALSVALAYLVTLPVPGYTGTHNPLPTESYCDTAARLSAILARLAKAQRDLAAHAALPSVQTPPAWQDPERFNPSPLLRREILTLDATEDEKASLIAADWPSQDEQPKTTVDAQAAALERLQALRREQRENAVEPCVSCGFFPSLFESAASCDCKGCHCDPCRRFRGENPDDDPTCSDCGEPYDIIPGSNICEPCAKQHIDALRQSLDRRS